MNNSLRYKGKKLVLLGISGLSLFLLLAPGCSKTKMVQVNTALAGREKEWTFVGRSSWTEKEGAIYSPPTDFAVYVDHPEFRWSKQYAYPTTQFFSDSDTSITFQRGCGIALRAQDSVRLYTVGVTDMERKGPDYRVALLLHDESGYRTELASGYAPHSVVSEDCLHGRITGEKCSPDPATLRVKAEGPKITAYIDGREIFTAEDSTYLTGTSGIFAGLRDANTIRDYKLTGVPAKVAAPGWKQVDVSEFAAYPYASGARDVIPGSPI